MEPVLRGPFLHSVGNTRDQRNPFLGKKTQNCVYRNLDIFWFAIIIYWKIIYEQSIYPTAGLDIIYQ